MWVICFVSCQLFTRLDCVVVLMLQQCLNLFALQVILIYFTYQSSIDSFVFTSSLSNLLCAIFPHLASLQQLLDLSRFLVKII